ncbi:MAG: preprotein translocase subunit SecG [Hyphomicrobiales bacterium]|nr:preprotein translocase subunit SecG [Hyphomicrobiales bacterium]MCY4049358.1 preprotein translocase subunit SecG [Hyphomicrobiales bacterium]
MSGMILIIHVLLALVLVVVVLLQRSEGGALGIGGGGGMMSGRSAGNALTKITAILAVCFFATSMGLALLDRGGGDSILPNLPGPSSDGITTPAPAPAPIPQPDDSEQ